MNQAHNTELERGPLEETLLGYKGEELPDHLLGQAKKDGTHFGCIPLPGNAAPNDRGKSSET